MTSLKKQKQQGGAGAADWVQSVAGGPGNQQPISQQDNTISLKGGKKSCRNKKYRKNKKNLLTRIMNIVMFKKRSFKGKSFKKGSFKKRHTYRKK